MIDQLVIGSVASYDDFDASVKERKIKAPKKKSIKATVPFSNVTHDFSKINGELYWEERPLEYVFEITADNPEELEEKKQAFCGWIMNVMEEELHDPFIRDYHFIATFADIDPDDSEIEKSTITVSFTAYPYMIADRAKVYENAIDVGSNLTFSVVNDSCHRLIPTVTLNGSGRIVYGNLSIAMGEGSVESEAFMLSVGRNTFYVENLGEAELTVKISFHEEVF